MGISSGTTEFIPSRTVEYGKNGQVLEAQFIELREPTDAHASFYLKLDQMCVRALAQAARSMEGMADKKASDEQPASVNIESLTDEEYDDHARKEAETIKMMLRISEIDVSKFVETFALMACRKGESMCALDGEVPMTEAIWKTISVKDRFSMAVWWVAFFAMPLSGEGGINSAAPSKSQSPPMAQSL